MAEYTETIETQPIKRGDKWMGMVVGPVLVNGGTPSGNLTRVRMYYVKGSKVFKFDSDANENPDAPIEITDPVNWIVTVPPVDSFLGTEGFWDWDMEFYEGTGGPLTFYQGKQEVTHDVTR